ncbi:M15 family metallopeptidase [Methylocapsa palsarum]|uniref:D-alanyl-D-alanine dipeptidase n=1 Tax=Methylocapsa palsarum TaxID=1612308 RepID=A0A1I4AEZ2_9HYPH|nr:M15 family metallopeptidase [Methylocapsa palsarum]SFK54346.1 D-alanyl-D-alanine dipeptidase [Methylocapsa palsarum]
MLIGGAQVAISLLTLGPACGCAAARAERPEGFVRLADLAPGVQQDMRYAGANNFIGRPLPGYGAPRCWLRREAAEALAAAQKDAEKIGLRLVVYDCYRPQRATRAFIEWAQDGADQTQKAEYYPHIDKRALFERGYIAKNSAHSTGVAVDLAFAGLDFGAHFDLFDDISATRSPAISATARQNRERLVALMRAHGFANFDQEWWHFTLEGVKDAAPCDFEIE